MARPTQAASVNETIITWIDEGRILPGDLVDEKHLMEACTVSRTPVREALIQLEADGLLVRHPRKGMHLFRPSVKEFLAILEVHANLEAQAAQMAALRISPAQSKRLHQSVEKCRTFAETGSLQDHAGYYALNLQFHEVIATASANPFLTDLIKLNARKLMAYYRLRYRTPGAIETSAREHVAIADRIAGRDPDGAGAAMAAHFNYDRETVMHMLASVQ